MSKYPINEATDYSVYYFHLVCGGRDGVDRQWVAQHLAAALRRAQSQSLELVIVTGAAAGYDRLATYVGRELGLKVVSFPADWKTQGRSAGHRRNEEMAEYLTARVRAGAKADVVAFPGGSGTAHMRQHAKAMGLAVYAPAPKVTPEPVEVATPEPIKSGATTKPKAQRARKASPKRAARTAKVVA